MTTLTEKMLTYALGRGLEYDDAPAVRAIVTESAKTDYRFTSLILGVVQSPPFQMRRSQSMIVTEARRCRRRTFLRGAGAVLGLPLLDAMVPALSAVAGTAG